MSHSPEPTPIDAHALSRRELQYLARELELCRGNAKSDVIVEHVVSMMASSDGAARVQKAMDAMPDDLKSRTPAATPAKSAREPQREEVTPRAMKFAEEETPRRSSRKSAEATMAEPEAEPAQTAKNSKKETQAKSSPQVGRKMGFEAEESGGTTDDEPMTTKKKTPTKENVVKPVVEVVTAKATTPAKKSPAKSPAAKRASSPGPVPTAKASTTPTRRTTPTKATGRSPLANVSNVAAPAKVAASNVEELVNSANDLVFVGSERVKCTTTGHEMKADYDLITAYTAGKRYQRARAQKQSFTKFAPMFVDHPDEKKPHMVWCSVTQTAIARDVERIEAHIQGPRYQKELSQWQADQKAAAAAAVLAAEKQAARAKVIQKKIHAGENATKDAKPSASESKKRKAEAIGAKGDGPKRSRVKVAADNV